MQKRRIDNETNTINEKNEKKIKVSLERIERGRNTKEKDKE